MKTTEEEYDLVGLGFGPANLALSIALRESAEVQELGLRFHFFEKQEAFGWHSSLLLPGAQLQVSPMKDLATMRDPTSSYTFTNYLHKQGRLASFINREASIPSRREWSAYLHWAATRMADAVTYGREVVAVEPVKEQKMEGGPTVVRKWRLIMRGAADGEMYECLARNLTVAIGGIPVTPEPFDQVLAAHTQCSSYIAHSSAYLPALSSMERRLRQKEARLLSSHRQTTSSPSVTELNRDAPLRFAVIGGGQSAAEISLHLRRTFPTAHVSLIFRASALIPSDDSAFVNAMAFDPERTDAFWRAGYEERAAWLKEFRRTNYAVVRSDVLNELHTTVYDQTITFPQPWPNADGLSTPGQLHIRPNTQVDTARLVEGQEGEEGGKVMLTVRDLVIPQSKFATLDDRTESYDAVFLATGFKRSPECVSFLKPLQAYYPRLDPDAEQKKAALGFAGEQDSFDVLASMVDDEAACERLRHRTRGITRDYRLVSYSSDAFYRPGSSSSNSKNETLGRHSPSNNSAIDSGASTPRRGSDMSDSDTLADSDENIASKVTPHSRRASEVMSEEERRLRGPRIESGIYFLGGNEASHGLSDSLLSIVAHRAGELTTSVLQRSRVKRGAAGGVTRTSKASAGPGLTEYARRTQQSLLKSTLVDSVQQSMADLRAG